MKAVAEYGDLKKRLAREYTDDIAGYVEVKSEFLLRVLREVGFAPTLFAGIEQMNRRNASR